MGKGERERIWFTRSIARRVEVDFDGGEVSSDGGLLRLREVDRQMSLTGRVALARATCATL